jgi:hypothetical protein
MSLSGSVLAATGIGAASNESLVIMMLLFVTVN